jgi:hypothetical protein
MDWFKRYGIPGAVFWAFLILWIGALHNCVIPKTICPKDIEKAKIIAAIAAGTFLPIGYLMAVIGQLIYHLFPGIGMDTRVRKSEKKSFRSRLWLLFVRVDKSKTPELLRDSWKEWKQEAYSVNRTILRLCRDNNSEGGNVRIGVEGMRFIHEWMTKRMGMVVVNFASMLAVIVAPYLSLLLTLLLDWKFCWKWLLFAVFMSILLLFICEWSRRIFVRQLVRIESIWLQYLDTDHLSPKTITDLNRQIDEMT